MATITIPDELQAQAQARAAEGGFASIDEYVIELLRRDVDPSLGVPEHLRVKSNEELLRLVRDGLASPAQVMTQAEFDRRRAELIAKYGPKAAG